MVKFVLRALVCGMVAGSVIGVDGPADAGQKKRPKQQRVVPASSGTHVAVQVVFAPREVQVLREYYTPRYRRLPPGLQKKYRRTGQLPPGWQKKLEPFPSNVERQLVVLPPGYRRGVFDGHAVIVNPKTNVIFDVAVLF